jgi:hypothetical protein
MVDAHPQGLMRAFLYRAFALRPVHTYLYARRGGGQPRPSQGPRPPPRGDENRKHRHKRDRQRQMPEGHERPPGGRGPAGLAGRPPQQRDLRRGFKVPLLPRLKLNFRTPKGTHHRFVMKSFLPSLSFISIHTLMSVPLPARICRKYIAAVHGRRRWW